MSTSRHVLAITIGALILPLLVLGVGSVRSGSVMAKLAEPILILSNWFYMVVPHLLVLLVAAVVRPARKQFLPWSLVALSLALLAFQSWVWWWVPVRESGLAWVLYFPLTAIVLAFVAVAAFWRGRSNPSIERTSPGKPGDASHVKR